MQREGQQQQKPPAPHLDDAGRVNLQPKGDHLKTNQTQEILLADQKWLRHQVLLSITKILLQNQVSIRHLHRRLVHRTTLLLARGKLHRTAQQNHQNPRSLHRKIKRIQKKWPQKRTQIPQILRWDPPSLQESRPDPQHPGQLRRLHITSLSLPLRIKDIPLRREHQVQGNGHLSAGVRWTGSDHGADILHPVTLQYW